MAAKEPKLSDIDLINRWVWFYALFFACLVLIACFGLVAEF